MNVQKININNELIEPDENGVCDIRNVLREHQDLVDYVRNERLQFVTIGDWALLSANADPNTFYFIGR